MKTSSPRRALVCALTVACLVITLCACSRPRYELNNTEMQKVIAAIETDKPRVIQEYLKKGMDPNGRRPDGVPFLIAATQQGQTDIVRDLITAHGNVNIRSADGMTPLLIAAMKGRTDMAQFMVSWGANVDLAKIGGEDAGTTPLIVAASGGYTEVVQALLDKGAKRQSKNAKGETALGLALKNGHADTADALRKGGATQ